MLKKLFIVLGVVVLAVVGYRSMAFSPTVLSFSGPTMGTTYTVKFVSTKQHNSTSLLKQDVDEVLVHINRLMSTYDPNSELSRFNQLPSGGSMELSPELGEVIDQALLISEMSGGEYDVTVGPLVNLWGFGPGKKSDQVPTDEEIAAAKAQVGYHRLVLEQGKLTKKASIYVDLSSIAKGYGVDKVAESLERAGIDSYLVEVGGELRSKGHKPNGEAWLVGIESPAGGHNIAQRVISPGDAGIATSGDYRNYFEKNGVRYSHTINPTTGRPITHRLVSVTIIANNAMLADGLATALTVLGPEKGLELANENGIAAYMLVKEDLGFKEIYSEAFRPYLTE
ncbi:FAD:protein FMN transferase [Maribrevibacterium harenarium]|uniref:FAD:protein FMN transferase n=1 Tax=Maribrevibacterium harenarium TaxID=2589817 RepID=A0A501WSG1_9GAMM|nr:FAD:protein FMN transferase [Maribrevibacterium harenarium]TPE51295.1 FAD:protein FMN transferase [Maribrevibacterium harenarium]